VQHRPPRKKKTSHIEEERTKTTQQQSAFSFPLPLFSGKAETNPALRAMQYVQTISRPHGCGPHRRGDEPALFGANAVPAPRPAPRPVGTRANRTVAAASAAYAQTFRSNPAGHNQPRKKVVVITLAASPAFAFRLRMRSR
jgi:hypothetical protein